MRSKKRYTKNYKVDAVKLVTEQGLDVNIVSERLGISFQNIYRWIEEYRLYGDEAFCGSGKALTVKAKFNQKNKQIADLQMELEILKKAAAYFAKKHQKE